MLINTDLQSTICKENGFRVLSTEWDSYITPSPHMAHQGNIQEEEDERFQHRHMVDDYKEAYRTGQLLMPCASPSQPKPQH